MIARLSPGGYLVGGGALLVGLGLLVMVAWPALTRLWSRVCVRRRLAHQRWMAAQARAGRPGPTRPVGAHRPVRVLRPALPPPAAAPRPRSSVEHGGVMPGWSGPTWQYPQLADSTEALPRQRGAGRG